jgi:methylmalonyl-CoA mutase
LINIYLGGNINTILRMETTPYQSKHKIRIVTAAALFDGHDAAINIMRRIIQSSGAEVIHLGHDRSAQEVVLLL